MPPLSPPKQMRYPSRSPSIARDHHRRSSHSAHHLAGVSLLAHVPDPQAVHALALWPPGDLVGPFVENPIRAPLFKEGFLPRYEIVHCHTHIVHLAVLAPLQPRRFACVSVLALLQIYLHLRKGVQDLCRQGRQHCEVGAGVGVLTFISPSACNGTPLSWMLWRS